MSENQQQPKAEPVKPAPQKLVVQDDSALSYMMDTARFEHLYRISQLMASAALTPKHLKGQTPQETAANCFRVVSQAMRWGLDPFSVCDETYVVHGRLGYQGKLVAAVVNARAGLAERLKAEYRGEGIKRTVTVSGLFKGEEDYRTVDLSVEQAKTDNTMWTKDPDQKLWYSGVTKWARRHCPEIILGIITDEELDREQPAPEPPIGRVNLRANGVPVLDPVTPAASPEPAAAAEPAAVGVAQAGEPSTF